MPTLSSILSTVVTCVLFVCYGLITRALTIKFSSEVATLREENKQLKSKVTSLEERQLTDYVRLHSLLLQLLAQDSASEQAEGPEAVARLAELLRGNETEEEEKAPEEPSDRFDRIERDDCC